MSHPLALASFADLAPDQDEFFDDVLKGLRGRRKHLSAKFFYDDRGSDLFNLICETPEYYPTRTETALLARIAPAAASLIGVGCYLIEYGTGSSGKMRIILDALESPAAYVAVDISREHLLRATRALAAERSDLAVHAVCADFSKPFDVPRPAGRRVGRKVAFFPGSSLGNFDPPAARAFLETAAGVVGPGGGMLIGIDLKKDETILNAAYNDAQGITAAFNLNLLERINRELGGSFDVSAFAHRAFYNSEEGRIETHLVSLKNQDVDIAGQRFHFSRGESIHTENSYKYSISEFQDLARSAGFLSVRAWTDADDLFSIHYLQVPARHATTEGRKPPAKRP